MNQYTQLAHKDATFEPHYTYSVTPYIDSARSGSANSSTNPTSKQREKVILTTLYYHQRLTVSSQDIVNIYTPNIVLFGETGVGKSSIINLIAGQKLAHTSNNALGCTFQHQQYIVTLDGTSCALWDTTGLDEGSEGTAPAAVAESNLRSLIRGLARAGGIHLVMYCIRASRLTNALRHNYDLFYVAVCRKKVPVALVVTGLEHQQGEMETWWDANEGVLRRSKMRFDAHACVTTLDIDDDVIQERRSDSQRRLRELVVRYSGFTAWKTEPSFVRRVLPMFRAVLNRTSSIGKQENTTIIRKVVVCDLAEDTTVEFSPGITAVWERCTGRIGDGQYEFVRMDKHALRTHTRGTLEDVGDIGAGVLVFYTSTLLSTHISPTDVDALKTFYDIAGGHICPVIIVLRGCDDDEVAKTCLDDIASRHSNIRAHVVPLPSTVDDKSSAQAMLNETIEKLCIEHVEVKISRFGRTYKAGKRLLTAIVEEVTSVDRAHVGGVARSMRSTRPTPSPNT